MPFLAFSPPLCAVFIPTPHDSHHPTCAGFVSLRILWHRPYDSRHSQGEEKERSAAALSRAEDLQGKLDRIAVADTLRGVPGGVSASSLIESFVGTALRQSQHVQVNRCDV